MKIITQNKHNNKTKRPQRCTKLKNNMYVIKEYNYDNYYKEFCNDKNDLFIKIINSINRFYHMTNLPYNQTDYYQSIQFTKLQTINLINVPSLILHNIILYLDLKSIYMLSRSCWKILLFSRTNIIVNHIICKYKCMFKKCVDDYKNNKQHFITHMLQSFDFYEYFFEQYNDTTYINLHNIDTNIDNFNCMYKNPYSYQIYKNNIHIIEVLLYGYKYVIFMQVFEYTIKRLFNHILLIDNLMDIYDMLDEKLEKISCGFCNNKCKRIDTRWFGLCTLHNYKSKIKNKYYFDNKPFIYQSIKYYFDDNFKYDYVYDL